MIYMQRNQIYVHSHLVLNTVLEKWNEMEKQNRETATTNSTKTTNHYQY